MSLAYAVDRLYDMGWEPGQAKAAAAELELLADGRPYPALFSVQQHFARSGLRLLIKPNLIFNCYQATWRPQDQPADPDGAASATADEQHGTVVGSCEREAAVAALAQLLANQAQAQLAGV